MPEDVRSNERTFRQRLDALVGTPFGAGGPAVAPDPVNQPMIRHWATAFEDQNPVYTDPDVRGGVAVRRHRGAAADAADVDDGDAEAQGASPSGAGSPVELEGDTNRCPCSTKPDSSARSPRTRSSRSSATCASASVIIGD